MLFTAGVGKISSVRAGSDAMAQSVSALWPLRRLPSPARAKSLAHIVVITELAILVAGSAGVVVVLAVGSTGLIVVALAGGVVLFGLFAAVEALVIRRGERPVCACFGARSHPVSVPGTLRTAALAVFAAVALTLYLTPSSLSAPAPRDVVLALLLGVVVGAVMAGVDDIVSTLRPLPSTTRPS